MILVDGERRAVDTRAPTVGEVLREQNIVLGEQDRVEPPDYTPIERTATITIVRVVITGETKREPLEFQRIYTREENLPEGQVRVTKLGANGEVEIQYQITLEDGREVSRREISRKVLKEPVNELLLVGTQGAVAPVPISGTLAYIGKGNAWIVRDSTGERRPLTTEGDLDGRVFDLSPDGKYLLFSRNVGANAAPSALNTLWMIDTVPFNAEARRVPIDNALYAQWAPDGSAVIAYTTGERTPGAPGWKAFNDLNVAKLNGVTETLQVIDTDIQTQTIRITPTPRPSDTPPPTAMLDPNITPDPAIPTALPPPTYTPRPPGRPFTRTIYITSTRTTTFSQTAKTPITVTNRVIVPRSAPAPYSWWGWNLAWSPDVKMFAYAFANQVGLIPFSQDAPQGKVLSQFADYNTRGDWVWIPQLTWSPDAHFVAATVHAPPNGAERAEDATGFDLELMARDEKLSVPLARNTGMWAFPAWSPPDARGESKIAFGVAQNQVNSERSRYALYIMDRDGSNRERIYPVVENALEGVRVVQFTWSPDGSQLIALREGDLWLYDLASKQWTPLTANGDSKLARWRR
ncbi:MAG TPA: G5 domain-containing protein [Anaerolineae bacterium]|nr:G5 domain-containing protein [Anaerolineae bacterium]